MIEFSTSVTPPVKGAPAPAGAAAAGDFLLTLIGFLDAGGDALGTSALPGLPGKRQAVAEDGKGLPVETIDKDASKDLIWLPVGMILPAATPMAPSLAPPGMSGTIAPAVDNGAPPLAIPAKIGVPGGEAIAPLPSSPDRAPAAAGEAPDKEAVTITRDALAIPRALVTMKAELPIRGDPATAAAPRQSQLPPLTQPAGQVFAVAIAAVQSRRDERRPSDAPMPPAIAGAAPEAVHTPVIAPAADAKQAALDLRQDNGLQGMIDKDASKDLIWLPVGMILPAVTPMAPSLAPPGMSGTIVPAVDNGAPPLAIPAKMGLAEIGVPGGKAIAALPPSPDWTPAAAGEAPDKDAVTITRDALAVPRALVTIKAELPIRGDPATAAAPRQSQLPPLTQPAGQAFAVAIAAVQSRRDERRPSDAPMPPAIAGAAPEAVHTPVIAPAADAKQAALDLRQDSGLQGMIDRIEILRDDADSRDTRIRLVPDALGAVDVSLRKEGERVHVHFNAENQASARLLHDAQPRLAELAEARGIKLGQATVGSDGDPGTGHPRPQPLAAPIPAAAPPKGDTAADIVTDLRIA